MPPSASTILTVTDVAKSFGASEIFSGVTFQVTEREHVALVGVNGAGKSTLLHIVAGVERANAGVVVQGTGLRVTYLPQEARFTSDRSVREETRLAYAATLDAAAEMRELEGRMGAAANDEALGELLATYDRLQTRFEAAGGYDIEHRTDEVLMGLGFSEPQFDEPVARLSGGQKTRVALAKALLGDPDLLLLDEPTNHLDLEMLEWLEGFLRGWSGACLIVSHDRYFLDRVTTRTLDLSFGRLEDYPAPYARYLRLREERMSRRVQEYEEQQAFIARTEEFVRKYKAGQRSKEARGRQTRLERLERLDRPQEHEGFRVKMNTAVRSGQTALSITPMRVGYRDPDGEQEMVTTPELTLARGERVGLVGPNGSGKTTLLKTLVGDVPPLKGRFQFGTNVKVGYYAQGHEGLPADGTALSIILATHAMGEESARTYLGRFLFSEDDVFKTVGSLSGGERSRLALALLLLQQANVLILDEPTNHLDIHTRETLEEMLAAFDGTILFVSHDRFFIDRIASRIWAIADGSIKSYLGNYTDYQRRLGRRPDPVAATKDKDKESDPAKRSAALEATSTNGTGAAPRPPDARLQKSMLGVERDIARLEGKLNELSDALTVAGIDADREAIGRLGTEYERTQTELEGAYARWEEMTSQFELAAGSAAVR